MTGIVNEMAASVSMILRIKFPSFVVVVSVTRYRPELEAALNANRAVNGEMLLWMRHEVRRVCAIFRTTMTSDRREALMSTAMMRMDATLRQVRHAIAAPLLLTGCLWGPGKFASDLTLKKDGSFILNYRGEIVIQMPPDEDAPKPWSADIAHCTDDKGKDRACTKAEIATPEGRV